MNRRKRAHAEGKRCREVASRNEQGRWKPSARHHDPMELVLAATRGRVPHLVPIKLGRMAASPFGFFRGAANVMAADLASLPSSGISVQICGDAHVRNLGAYAAPDGRLVFDINDFDETVPGPWEWDVKRMATSLMLAGREANDSDEQACTGVKLFVRTYREFMHRFSAMSVLDVARYRVSRILRLAPVAAVLRKADRAAPQHNLEKLAVRGKKGRWSFREKKPLLDRVPEKTKSQVRAAIRLYRESLSPDHRFFLDQYESADVAFKVVGTGSVGLRDYVVLCFGRNEEDPLFLQVKEEIASCYAPYLPELTPFPNEGRRVVVGQHRMQAQSDILLGWTRMGGRDYLVRQLADHKASIDVNDLKGQGLLEYALMCGEVLAKGHARSGDPCKIAGYLGNSDKFDVAISKFALAYADQTARDHAKLLRAVKGGKVKVTAA